MTRDEQASPDGDNRILITGKSGLIGSHLAESFVEDGYRVFSLTRRKSDDEQKIHWQPSEGRLDADKLEGFTAVVHLAGENIFGRWTEAKKRRIYQSRKEGTHLLCQTLAELDDPPEVIVSASGIDYYGETGSQVVDEESPAGDTFLAEVCTVWEEACDPARKADIRTVNARTGAVFSARGGALETMLLPFKLGLGAKVGSGEQFMSWISMADVVRGYRFLVDHNEIDGPVNLTSPNPVTNAELTDTLGRVLGRPTFLKAPSFAIKLGAGQMGEEMLLGSTRAIPRRLNESGFEFRFPELEAALEHELNA